MPYISDQEWNDQKRKVEELEKKITNITDDLKHTKGQPIVQGYPGKRFDLNDNLNVVKLLKRITDAEARITVLETP